jgi:hypothetical protein
MPKKEYLEDLMNVKYPPLYGQSLLEVDEKYPPSFGLMLLEVDIKCPPCRLTLLEVDHSASYSCCWK